jgi:hypothetical protein
MGEWRQTGNIHQMTALDAGGFLHRIGYDFA